MMEGTPEHAMDTNPRPQAVKRLDSKENPFLPGGDLSKETDDLLKRATIIRDQFLLDDEAKARLLAQQSPGSSPPGTDQHVQEGKITPAHSSPVDKPKENGQSGEAASPGSVHVEMNKDTPGSPHTRSDVPKDKKKRNKCCSVM